MRELRLKRGISIGALAAELGVSRRTVSKYEMESMDTSVDIALRLEDLFDQELIQPVDIFGYDDPPEAPLEITDHILSLLAKMGFDVIPTTQAPFNAITQNEDMIFLTGVSKFSASMLKKARLMSNLSIVTMTHSALIVDGLTKIERVEETAVIEKRELEGIYKTREFADLVFERQNRD
jgi:putative transcriptional regulator